MVCKSVFMLYLKYFIANIPKWSTLCWCLLGNPNCSTHSYSSLCIFGLVVQQVTESCSQLKQIISVP